MRIENYKNKADLQTNQSKTSYLLRPVQIYQYTLNLKPEVPTKLCLL